MLTLEMMKRRWPHGDQHIPGLMEGIVAAAPRVGDKYGFADKPMLWAHFMAQASEECGQGLEMIESLNYTVQRLRAIFPTHFTLAMAQRWAHNEKMIGEIAYGGRMGNAPPPSTDGYDFRGEGLTQVTGRDGHAALQKFLDEHWRQGDTKFSVLENPELLIDPDHALECGIADFIVCGCLPFAEKDNVLGVTRKLNGGTNGLPERKRQLRLWKPEFGLN